jgi:phage gp46-like protein
MSADTRKAFEAWWADAGRVLVVKPEVAELIWLASRSQALEEAALIAEKTYAKDAFRFVLGTEAAAAIRKLGAQE